MLTAEERLWVAALARYVQDARAPSAYGDEGEALADLEGDAVILRRLAELAGYDPEATVVAVRREVLGGPPEHPPAKPVRQPEGRHRHRSACHV
ncbi:hypothetical protein [Alkalilimnicola ehrlichii]|uniref:Uncharacterized protein n=1 Tax=Alkalilimnicola ehrlichii (strain ATCC BAA-1101 / DSM 17681 / MLHE-1) TaxID=187272 RepID=Q0AAY8_ALKEH|nr:hypothetical protein [Alkalilimnicola ehrlichii]ABI55999.1 hypothetical protein Mlg_0645 [Alkalilimnicola ehrlichii MLHE-1]